MSRIEYRVALALILPVFVPCMLSARPAAAKQHVAATDTLSSIAVAGQQQPPATQPPQQTQPPATQPPQQTQPPQGTPPTQPPTGTQPAQPPTGTQTTQPPTGTQPTQPPTATQPTQPPAGTQPQQTAGGQLPPPTSGAVDSEGAGALLDRMQTILDAALGNRPADNQAVGTTGVVPGVDSKSKAGKISVDRAALDEVLAEVQQLRTMLRVRQ